MLVAQPTSEVSLSDEEDSLDDQRPGSSTSTSSESESESSSGDDAVPEEEEQAGAASGALRGVKQSELDAMSTEEKDKVLARARAIQRQVHFRDATWPEEWSMCLWSSAFVTSRRRRLIRLLSVLESKSAYDPSEKEILTGIPHLNRAHPDTPFDVAHALSTHKLHYQAVLDKLLKDTSFDDKTCAFCRMWPNLHPVSGGDRVVQHVNQAHPVWDVLRRNHGASTVPQFLRRLFAKHDGEARLIGGTS